MLVTTGSVEEEEEGSATVVSIIGGAETATRGAGEGIGQGELITMGSFGVAIGSRGTHTVGFNLGEVDVKPPVPGLLDKKP
jgi:hypothetical protein